MSLYLRSNVRGVFGRFKRVYLLNDQVFFQDDNLESVWTNGNAYKINNDWLLLIAEKNEYVFNYRGSRIVLSDDSVLIRYKDGSIFSVFEIIKDTQIVFRKRYLNFAILNPFLDPRMRDDADIWFSVFYLLKNSDWRELPSKFDPERLINQDKDEFINCPTYQIVDESN